MAHRDDRNQVKGFMAKNNKTFKLKHIKVLIESLVIKVTACRNGNICIEGRWIRYLIPVCVSQLEITKTTCICLLQNQTLTEFTKDFVLGFILKIVQQTLDYPCVVYPVCGSSVQHSGFFYFCGSIEILNTCEPSLEFQLPRLKVTLAISLARRVPCFVMWTEVQQGQWK